MLAQSHRCTINGGYERYLISMQWTDQIRRVKILLVLAAVITPTGDPFTLSVVAIPLYLLYELSILMVKDKPQEEEDTAEEQEQQTPDGE